MSCNVRVCIFYPILNNGSLWRRLSATGRLLSRRAQGEPLPYITGAMEFYGMQFGVTPAVLIPRPETEMLVELASEWLARHENSVVLDVGTGSGCIAVAISPAYAVPPYYRNRYLIRRSADSPAKCGKTFCPGQNRICKLRSWICQFMDRWMSL